MWLLIACGGDDEPEPDPVDAGVDAAADAEASFEVEAPRPHAPPALPELGPCPEGWSEVADADVPAVVHCEPWPSGEAEECPDDQAHFPGGAGCEPVGPPCPAGDWPEDLPADAAVLYVLAGAAGGGDGSLESPFATIADAIAVAEEGAVIALSKGTFDEDVFVNRAVSLWGACVGGTTLTSSRPSTQFATLSFRGPAGQGVRNVTITGERPGVRVTATSGPVEMLSVVLRDSPTDPVVVEEGGDLSAQDVVVRDSQGVFGIYAATGAQVELSRVVLRAAGIRELYAIDEGTRIEAIDVALLDASPSDDPQLPGMAVLAYSGGVISLQSSIVERAPFLAAGAAGPGSELVLQDTLVRSGTGASSPGVDLEQGAHGTLTRVAITDAIGLGLNIQGEGTEVHASDLVISDTATSSGILGQAIEIAQGAHADLARTLIARSHSTGMKIGHEGTEVLATDLSIVRTLDGLNPFGDTVGCGIELTRGGRLELVRSEVSQSDEIGIAVGKGSSSLVATDLAVHDTVGNALTFGIGLIVQEGGSVTLERASFEQNASGGIQVGLPPAELTALDLVVRGTVSSHQTKEYGYGVFVFLGGEATLTRTLIEGNQFAGFWVGGEGAHAVAEELEVRDTSEQSCVADTCPEAGAGFGVLVDFAGSAEVHGFRVTGSALAGVAVADGSLDLSDGEVTGNPIGANVQDEGYDLGRLQSNVLYTDNDRNLDSAVLPVPDPEDAVIILQ